jgi:hypothetical protein
MMNTFSSSSFSTLGQHRNSLEAQHAVLASLVHGLVSTASIIGCAVFRCHSFKQLCMSPSCMGLLPLQFIPCKAFHVPRKGTCEV